MIRRYNPSSDWFDASELGPFKELWEAWNDAHDAMILKNLDHFEHAYEVQIKELSSHLSGARRLAAANEAMDMISISLNLMRRLGYRPTEIAEVARDRAKFRMQGQTGEILKKYP